jgi:hypothetical protein
MLSPIGGQASLRQMSIETAVNRSDSSFQYVVPTKRVPSGFATSSNAKNLLVSAMFAASSDKASPVDIWNNVRIPKIEHYEETTKPDGNGWFKTESRDDDPGPYSSFVGISIDGVQSDTTTTGYDFRLQTEYLQVMCDSVTYPRDINESFTGELPSNSRNATGNNGVVWWSDNDLRNRSFTALGTLKPFNFSYYRPLGNIPSISCSMENTYVEVEVLCAVNSTCRAVMVRRSQLPQLPPAFTFMDIGMGSNWVTFMGSFMPGIGGQEGVSFNPSILENYLMRHSPNLVSGVTSTDIKRTDDKTWSERFGQLLNSYWICVSGQETTSAGINTNNSYFWDTNITFKPLKLDLDSPESYCPDSYCPDWTINYNWTDDSGNAKVWSSQGNRYEHIEVIKAHKPWAITLSIASLVLIAFSLVPPLVRYFLTTGPDIAMNFSSLATRNNSYVPIPASGSFLPASDRFRLLKDLRLRFVDVESKSDVGNLVIAAQDVEKLEYSRVRKGRLYE